MLPLCSQSNDFRFMYSEQKNLLLSYIKEEGVKQDNRVKLFLFFLKLLPALLCLLDAACGPGVHRCFTISTMGERWGIKGKPASRDGIFEELCRKRK